MSEVHAPAPLSPSPDERLRDALLARMRPVAWADLDAEMEALEAAGECAVPTVAELEGLAPDPLAGPPDGEWAWLAELPDPLREEYLAAAAERAVPEGLPAGWGDQSTGDGCGFAAGGVADELAPGPVLAGLASDICAAGLGRLSDDELIGVLRAGRRLASWSASVELDAAGELMRRRLAQEAAGCAHVAEHADAEVAAALTLTGRAAGRLLDLAMGLERLPLTGRALAAGVIDLPRAAAIVEELSGLGVAHAAAVEARVLARAAGQTTTQLRAAARRAVIAADPGAARKRREEAQRDARVERWAEHAGTAALAGRDLPPAGALAADQHVSELACALRAAGVAGTMDQLRAQVFLALLTGQPASSVVPPAAASPGDPGLAGGGPSPGPGGPGTRTASSSPSARSSPRTRSDPGAPSGPGVPGSPGVSGSPGVPGSSGTPSSLGARGGPGVPVGPGAPGLPDGHSVPGSPGLPGSPSSSGGLAVAGAINLTMPLSTWLGLSQSPGEVAGFGPLGAQDCRSLGQLMAAHPQTRWCLTLLDEGDHPVAHGCARRRRRRSGKDPGSPGEGPGPPLGAWLAGITLQWLETGGCAHRREVTGYRPSALLEHLVGVRQQVCAFPGCQRAARRCDLDHTIAYDQGGRTCECNLTAR